MLFSVLNRHRVELGRALGDKGRDSGKRQFQVGLKMGIKELLIVIKVFKKQDCAGGFATGCHSSSNCSYNMQINRHRLYFNNIFLLFCCFKDDV